MKSVLRVLVGVFEIVSGGAGLYWVVAALTGQVSRDVAAMLWYGVFPVAAILAGVLLLLRKKYGFGLSVVVLALQVPVIKMALLSLNVGVAFSLTTSAYWAARPGESGVVLGINFLALAVLVALWVSRPKNPAPQRISNLNSNRV
jgi:hypothetical protein